MNAEEAALMAERFGWRSVTSIHYHAYVDKYGRGVTMILRQGGEHHLTDAGMARVLIELKPAYFGYETAPTKNPWEFGWWDEMAWETRRVCAKNPHKAVELAALAQIRGEHE